MILLNIKKKNTTKFSFFFIENTMEREREGGRKREKGGKEKEKGGGRGEKGGEGERKEREFLIFKLYLAVSKEPYWKCMCFGSHDFCLYMFHWLPLIGTYPWCCCLTPSPPPHCQTVWDLPSTAYVTVVFE